MPDVSLSDHTLAVVGAITGIVGSLSGGIALVNLLRERPRLELVTYTQVRGHDRELVMTAVNRGRRPAVVVHAGVALGVHLVSVGRLRRRRPHIDAERGQPEPGVLPATLAPWDALRWSFKYDTRQPPPPFIAFVQDDDGRYVWASKRLPRASRGAAQIARSFQPAPPQ